MSSDISPNLGAKYVDSIGAETLSVALIGPDGNRRWALAKALAEGGRANVREFDSYPTELDDLPRLLGESFDIIILDLDSHPDFALELIEKVSSNDAATIMVYSERADQNLMLRSMRAGAREYLLLPLEPGTVTEALARAAGILRPKARPIKKTLGRLLVFLGAKGGSGVTTVACNLAIALAQEPDQSTLLVDLALPMGDAALSLGLAAEHSTEDALRNPDRLDASFLQKLLVKHRSGVFVLAAPGKVPEVEATKEAIDKLLAIARHEFDHVVVDVGSRTDLIGTALFKEASTVYMVTQAGISELRNANRLISQFFVGGRPKLEIVVNRFEPRLLGGVNEDVITKALGRPVRWKIPDDQDATRKLQYSENGISLAETRISRLTLEMAGSITGRPVPQEKKKNFGLRGFGKSNGEKASGSDDAPSITASARSTPTIAWPTPDPITHGNALTITQLNATASVPGTLIYTPGPGYMLPTGTHTLWVTFTSDSERDTPVQAAVSIVVSKATPAISWPEPPEMTYGAALSAIQLNASASVPGKYEYSSASGEVLNAGTHTLSVTFTPRDETNYATTQAAVSLTGLMGTLPIALGIGAGGEARRPLGVSVVGGLAFSQLVTLFLTPVFYIYMEDAKRWGVQVFGSKRDAESETGSSPSGQFPSGPIGTPIARSKDAPEL